MNTPSAKWAAWAIGTGVTFTVMEAAALRRRDLPATLSHVLRSWLGLEPRRPDRHLCTGLFLITLGWVALHITSGRFGFDVRWPGNA